jgi:hypothetical protein
VSRRQHRIGQLKLHLLYKLTLQVFQVLIFVSARHSAVLLMWCCGGEVAASLGPLHTSKMIFGALRMCATSK